MTGEDCNILLAKFKNKLREDPNNPINEGINECISILLRYYLSTLEDEKRNLELKQARMQQNMMMGRDIFG